MKRVTFFAACCVVAVYCQSRTADAQTAHLTLQGGRHEFVSGGGTFDLTFTPQNTAEFFVRVISLTNDGLPAMVDFTFIPSTGDRAFLEFGATPLVPGKYKGGRFLYPMPDKPFLWVGFDGRGGNTTKGSFVIKDAIFAPDPNAEYGWDIIHFDATFKQRTDGQKAVLKGTFSYSAGTDETFGLSAASFAAVPEPSEWILMVLGGLALLTVRWVPRPTAD